MTLEEQAIKVLDESASDSESNIVDELVKEFPVLAGSLVKTINKRNKTNLEIPKKERISKNKILLDITSSLSKINGELIVVNSRLVAQNDLLRANLGFTSNSIGNLEYNDGLLASKLDSLLEALKIQNEFMREKEEDQERSDIEDRSEGQRDAASTFGFDDVSKRGKSVVSKLTSIFGDRLRNVLTKKILRVFTKGGMKGLLSRGKNLLGFKTAAKGFGNIALNPKQDKFMKPKWWNAIGDHIKPVTKPLTDKIAGIGESKWGKSLVQILNNPGKWVSETKVGKTATNILGNLDYKKVGTRLSKRMPKIMTRFSGKMIPGLGAGFSSAEAIHRISEGDTFGAWLATMGAGADTASMVTAPAAATGIGAAVPGTLQGISMGADVTLLLYDIFRAVTTPVENEMEHGGVIQAPPILTPAEKGAVIGGSGSSDIGHIVNASSMILDTFKVNLSGVSKLRNDFPAEGSTGTMAISPLAGSQPVLENEVKPKDGDNIAFNWKKPSDNIEQLRYKSDHPLGTEQPNPFKDGSTLYKNFERLRLYDKSGMTISSVSNISDITPPVTQTNNISDNISVEIDPTVRTKIVYVTKTISSGGNVVSGGGGNVVVAEIKQDKHKLSRLILAS